MEAIGSTGSIDQFKEAQNAKITAAKAEASQSKQGGGDDTSCQAAQSVGGAQGACASQQYPAL